jgi:hypothetical protein
LEVIERNMKRKEIMERIAGKSNENIYQQVNKKKGIERQKQRGNVKLARET